MTDPHPHLSWDDLDDLLMGTERGSVHVHLETCAACRKLASLDLEVVVQLQRLPVLSPSAGFADRVMAGVTAVSPVSQTAPSPLRSSALRWLKAAMLVLTVGGMASSVTWSLSHQALLQSLQAGMLGALRALVQNGLGVIRGLPEAAFVSALRDSIGGVGVGLAVTAFATAYLVGLLSLQRLLAPPRRPVPHAG
jgi:anti-sigma factor RsiW